jgi:hypothetical protein
MEVSQKTKRTYELQVRTLMEENWGKKSHIRQIIRGISGFEDKKLGVTSGSGPLTDSVITPPHTALRRQRCPARHCQLGVLVVHGQVQPLSADVVQSRAL